MPCCHWLRCISEFWSARLQPSTRVPGCGFRVPGSASPPGSCTAYAAQQELRGELRGGPSCAAALTRSAPRAVPQAAQQCAATARLPPHPTTAEARVLYLLPPLQSVLAAVRPERPQPTGAAALALVVMAGRW